MVLKGGGGFKADGPLIASLTDLEFKEEIIWNYARYYPDHTSVAAVMYFKLGNPK